MVIAVNRVALGFNCKFLNSEYFRRIAKSCPVSTALVDGSFLICKAGGTAWFVAPASTQITSQWANGTYNGISTGSKCCISEWGVLSNCLSNIGYTPTEWFIPTQDQLVNPGWVCRSNWGTQENTIFWSSSCPGSNSANVSSRLYFQNGNTSCNRGGQYKTDVLSVRAFRCVTY